MTVNINILDKNSILKGLEHHDISHADIVVIIRGGGSKEDFQVFNDMEVVTKIATLNSFTISGLGHTGDQTLTDLVTDFSAKTPSLAGTYLHEQLMLNLHLKEKVIYKSKETTHSSFNILQNKYVQLSITFNVILGLILYFK